MTYARSRAAGIAAGVALDIPPFALSAVIAIVVDGRVRRAHPARVPAREAADRERRAVVLDA